MTKQPDSMPWWQQHGWRRAWRVLKLLSLLALVPLGVLLWVRTFLLSSMPHGKTSRLAPGKGRTARHTQVLNAIFSSDGKIYGGGTLTTPEGDRGFLTEWDARTGHQRSAREFDQRAVPLALSGDGNQIVAQQGSASSLGGTLDVIVDGATVATMPVASDNEILAARFVAKDQELLVVSSHFLERWKRAAPDAWVRVWQRTVKMLPAESQAAQSLSSRQRQAHIVRFQHFAMPIRAEDRGGPIADTEPRPRLIAALSKDGNWIITGIVGSRFWSLHDLRTGVTVDKALPLSKGEKTLALQNLVSHNGLLQAQLIYTASPAAPTKSPLQAAILSWKPTGQIVLSKPRAQASVRFVSPDGKRYVEPCVDKGEENSPVAVLRGTQTNAPAVPLGNPLLWYPPHFWSSPP